jgi:hypothetical protein
MNTLTSAHTGVNMLILGRAQFSKETRLSVAGAVQVLSASGQPNYNSRRSIEVSVLDPVGKEIYNEKRVWQECTFEVPSSIVGTYSLWCAPL